MTEIFTSFEYNTHDNHELFVGSVVATKMKYDDSTAVRRLFLDVELDNGYIVADAPYYGGGIDDVTKLPHGIFVPPRLGQSVGMFFRDGNAEDPVVAFPIPQPNWMHSKFDEQFFNDMLDNENEIMIAHYSGSRIKMREDGKIEFTKKIGLPPAAIDFKLIIEITPTGVSIDTPGLAPIVLGNNIAAALCNNLPACIFSPVAPHTIGNLKVKV